MSHHKQESAETTSNRFQTRFLNLRATDTLPGKFFTVGAVCTFSRMRDLYPLDAGGERL